MGLGLLFVGYFTLTIAALPLPGIATFAGYLLAGYAATKLMAYQSWFRYMRLISFIGAILSFPALTTKICGYLGMEIGFLAFADTYLYLLAVDLRQSFPDNQSINIVEFLVDYRVKLVSANVT